MTLGAVKTATTLLLSGYRVVRQGYFVCKIYMVNVDV
jgi:hypothetical protein